MSKLSVLLYICFYMFYLEPNLFPNPQIKSFDGINKIVTVASLIQITLVVSLILLLEGNTYPSIQLKGRSLNKVMLESPCAMTEWKPITIMAE